MIGKTVSFGYENDIEHYFVNGRGVVIAEGGTLFLKIEVTESYALAEGEIVVVRKSNCKTIYSAEDYESLPEAVQDILSTFEDETYDECERVKAELNVIGWDCEYDLSGNITEIFVL
jgi:hypothetical protein